MQLNVNYDKKKSLQKKAIKGGKVTRIITMISHVLMFIGTIGVGLRALVIYFVPSLGLDVINGVLQKNTEMLFWSSISIVITCVLTSIFLKVLVHNLGGRDIGERVNEIMLVSNDSIRYMFRTRYQTAETDIIVFDILFKDITSVDYDKSLNKLILKGRFSSDVIEDYQHKVISDITWGNQSEIVIYDYFEPSLLQILKDHSPTSSYLVEEVKAL